VLEVLDKEKRQEHCASVGDHLLHRLRALQDKHDSKCVCRKSGTNGCHALCFMFFPVSLKGNEGLCRVEDSCFYTYLGSYTFLCMSDLSKW
jgi:hypothetical protein